MPAASPHLDVVFANFPSQALADLPPCCPRSSIRPGFLRFARQPVVAALIVSQLVLAAPSPVFAAPVAPASASEPAVNETTSEPQVPPSQEPASLKTPEQKAAELFRLGSDLYAIGRFEEAVNAFLDAQTMYPSPDFQYNIGACYEQLGKYEEAVRSFETFLRNRPNTQDRAGIEARITRLRGLAQVAATASQTPVAPAEVEGPAPVDQSPPAQSTVVANQTSSKKVGRGLVISGAAVMGLGGLAGLGGIALFGLRANAQEEKLAGLANGENPDGLTFARAQDIADEGQAAEKMQIISGIAGGGVLVVGAVLAGVGLYRRKNSNSEQQAWIRVLPGAVGNQPGAWAMGRF